MRKVQGSTAKTAKCFADIATEAAKTPHGKSVVRRLHNVLILEGMDKAAEAVESVLTPETVKQRSLRRDPVKALTTGTSLDHSQKTMLEQIDILWHEKIRRESAGCVDLENSGGGLVRLSGDERQVFAADEPVGRLIHEYLEPWLKAINKIDLLTLKPCKQNNNFTSVAVVLTDLIVERVALRRQIKKHGCRYENVIMALRFALDCFKTFDDKKLNYMKINIK